MSNQEKLLSLLQPKDYKSKIKLYCSFGELVIRKTENRSHEKQIKIEEL